MTIRPATAVAPGLLRKLRAVRARIAFYRCALGRTTQATSVQRDGASDLMGRKGYRDVLNTTIVTINHLDIVCGETVSATVDIGYDIFDDAREAA